MIPIPPMPAKLTNIVRHGPAKPSSMILQDAFLAQVHLKRKHETESEDGCSGEGAEIEQGSQMKRPRKTSTSNSLPSSTTTTTGQTTPHSIKPIAFNLIDSQTRANPDISLLNTSERPVPFQTPSRNHTPVLAPTSRPPLQPSSRVGSPVGWAPPLHLPSLLPAPQPPSRPTSPTRSYFASSNTVPGLATMYPQSTNPPIQNLSTLTSPMPEQSRGVLLPQPERGYGANRPRQQGLEESVQRPLIQTENVVYPHPSAFQNAIPNTPHFLNVTPQTGLSTPFVQGPAPRRIVHPHPHTDTVEPRQDSNAHQSIFIQEFGQHQTKPQQTRNALLSQPPPPQFQTGHRGDPEKRQSLRNIAPKPPSKGTLSMAIERNADILMDLINTKVEIGIKNSQLVNYGDKKAAGTNKDQAIETNADGLGVQERSNLMHKAFVAQACAWAEERRLLKKRQQELEEEKRVAEERRVADSERVLKERKEYKSKLEYLARKVKELQQDLAIVRGQDTGPPNKLGSKGRRPGVNR